MSRRTRNELGSILLALVLTAGFSARARTMSFSHFGIENGLSQNTVFSVTQDKEGDMWFSTYEGVDRFDGYNFTRIQFQNASNIKERKDIRLHCDRLGNIWATSGTLYLLDRASDSFQSFEALAGYNVKGFTEYTEGALLLLTDKGILTLKPEGLTVSEDPVLKDIHAISASYNAGCLAMAAREGYIAILENGNLTRIPFPQSRKVSDMLVMADHTIWMATDGFGLYRIKDGEFKNYTHKENSDNSLCSNYVRSIEPDGSGSLWIGTGNGLSIMNLDDGSLSAVFNDHERLSSLSSNSIKDIFRDTDGNIWLGTFYGGVNYYYNHQSYFTKVELDDNKENIIGAIAEDRDGTLWIGTGRNGIYHYDPETGDINKLNMYARDAEMTDIKAICFSNDGKRIFFGTGLGGLNVYSRTDGSLVHYSGNGYPETVYSIIEEDDRYLWLGSLTGLFLFDTREFRAEAVHPTPKENLQVYKLLRDPSGQVWIGADSKLLSCRLSIGKGGIPEISGITEHNDLTMVQDIFRSSSGDLWVATRKGMFWQHGDGEGWEEIKKSDGLSSKIIRGVEEDEDGKIWISTENGLNCYDPETGRVARYYEEDGLCGNVLNQYAHCRTSDGKLYFGGIRGLFSFDPEKIGAGKESRTPRISSMRVNGEELKTRAGEDIILQHYQKSLSMDFAVPNYSSWQKDEFRYRLIGAQDSWESAGPSHSVSYSNLRPGRYRFELVSQNADGVLSETYTTVITKKAVWYESIAARIAYVLLTITAMLSAAVAIIRMNKERITTESKEEIERQRALRFVKRTATKEELEFILKMLGVIRDNMADDKFGVEKLSSEMFMSRSNLFLKTKSITGVSPIDIIHTVRMEAACDLLRESDRSIAEISSLVGFSSPSYFAACFKKHTGVLPGKFRQ